MTKFDWTADRIAQLKKNWAAGFSASEIAAKFGYLTTRNSIISKIHRLKLPHPKGKPVVTKAYAPRKKKELNPLLPAKRQFVVTVTPPAPKLVAPKPLVLTNGEKCTLMHLSHATCRWPLGSVHERAIHFCGVTPQGKGPYCAFHAEVSRAKWVRPL